VAGVGLAAQARARPQKTAIVFGAERISFADLNARAGRAAALLAARGIGAGDRVAAALRNRPELFEVGFGASRLGAELVPISWRSRTDEARYLAEDSGAKLLVAEEDTALDLPVMRLAEYREHAARAGRGPTGDSPIVFRYYTSGTTGRPKAVERGRHDVERYLGGVRDQLRLFAVDGPDEVHLVCGPLSHSGPSSFAHYGLMLGHTIALMERFDGADALRLISTERVTWTFMAPVHFVRILAVVNAASFDVSSLRRVLHAGAPCPPTLKRQIMELFPPGAVWEFYGMTEGRATVITAEEWRSKPGSVGRAVEGAGIMILDEAGRELPPGHVGLVYVAPIGGARFSYAGDPAKTADAWRGDFYTVGDMGRLDGDGYLYLTDRAQDLIITGGVNVYPAEVEAVLHAHPAVADAAVLGVPDDEWGEAVKAIVEPAGPVGERELIAFCRERLSSYKCPKSVELVERLPRGEDGKVRKRELREPYWSGRGTRI
jgi:long-chain acyl-CoA synthetase